MPKCSNSAGSCQADIHYMLSTTELLPAFVDLTARLNYLVKIRLSILAKSMHFQCIDSSVKKISYLTIYLPSCNKNLKLNLHWLIL